MAWQFMPETTFTAVMNGRVNRYLAGKRYTGIRHQAPDRSPGQASGNGERAMAWQFMAETTFTAAVNGRVNRYLAGKRYTVRGGPLYADLRAKALAWSEGDQAGVIEGRARIQVLGEIEDRPPGRLTAG